MNSGSSNIYRITGPASRDSQKTRLLHTWIRLFTHRRLNRNSAIKPLSRKNRSIGTRRLKTRMCLWTWRLKNSKSKLCSGKKQELRPSLMWSLQRTRISLSMSTWHHSKLRIAHYRKVRLYYKAVQSVSRETLRWLRRVLACTLQLNNFHLPKRRVKYRLVSSILC